MPSPTPSHLHPDDSPRSSALSSSAFAAGLALELAPLEPRFAPDGRGEASGFGETMTRPAPLAPLYISFAALQAFDAVTTIRALEAGGVEVNPLLKGVAGNGVALVAVKAGATVATVYLAERLWKKNRVAAIVLMVTLNGVYVVAVAQNHRAAR
jgi:hypothetical protein